MTADRKKLFILYRTMKEIVYWVEDLVNPEQPAVACSSRSEVCRRNQIDAGGNITPWCREIGMREGKFSLDKRDEL